MHSLNLAGVQTISKEATRVTNHSATCLDLIAIDRNLTWESYRVSDITASDHFPVSVSIKISHAKELRPVLKRSFKKVDMAAVFSLVAQIKLPDTMKDDPSF